MLNNILCFDAVGWATGRASEFCYINSQEFTFGDLPNGRPNSRNLLQKNEPVKRKQVYVHCTCVWAGLFCMKAVIIT